jgi:hypothetical protein
MWSGTETGINPLLSLTKPYLNTKPNGSYQVVLKPEPDPVRSGGTIVCRFIFLLEINSAETAPLSPLSYIRSFSLFLLSTDRSHIYLLFFFFSLSSPMRFKVFVLSFEDRNQHLKGFLCLLCSLVAAV